MVEVGFDGGAEHIVGGVVSKARIHVVYRGFKRRLKGVQELPGEVTEQFGRKQALAFPHFAYHPAAQRAVTRADCASPGFRRGVGEKIGYPLPDAPVGISHGRVVILIRVIVRFGRFRCAVFRYGGGCGSLMQRLQYVLAFLRLGDSELVVSPLAGDGQDAAQGVKVVHAQFVLLVDESEPPFAHRIAPHLQ